MTGTPCSCEHVGIADAGELEQLRRADGAGREQYLAPGIDAFSFAAGNEGHAARPLAIEDDAARERIGDDGQIRAARGRREIAVHRAATQPIAAVYLQRRRALGRIGVVIGDSRVPGLHTGFDEGIGNGVPAELFDSDRAAATAPSGVSEPAILDLLEIREQVRIAPARAAGRAPFVVLRRMAANKYKAVDRARSAQDPAARPVKLVAMELSLRFGVGLPDVGFIVEQLADAERYAHPQPPVALAGLEQSHGVLAAFGESSSQHAAGRAGPDDDVIVDARR